MSYLYIPTHLKRWTLPRHYFGAEWAEYYVFLGQHRESDCLDRSNFRVAMKRLHAIALKFEEDKEEITESTVICVEESHWAVGWVQWIGIHESNGPALKAADKMAAGLEDYAILCEEDFSNLESEEAEEAWRNCSVEERVHLIRKWARGVSLFAARHDEFPCDDCGRIQERLLMPGGGIL